MKTNRMQITLLGATVLFFAIWQTAFAGPPEKPGNPGVPGLRAEIAEISNAGEIRVYDKNNQFLGILNDGHYRSVHIFVPSLNLPFGLHVNAPSDSDDAIIYYEDDDCKGTPYIAVEEHGERGWFPWLYKLPICFGGFYKADLDNPESFSPMSKSTASNGVCDCSQDDLPSGGSYYPMSQAELPFTLPIVYPIRYEYTTGE